MGRDGRKSTRFAASLRDLPPAPPGEKSATPEQQAEMLRKHVIEPFVRAGAEVAAMERRQQRALKLPKPLAAKLKQQPPKQAKEQPRKYRKRVREEVWRRIRKHYCGDDVGGDTPADVRRKISDKHFNPSWDVVDAALKEGPPKNLSETSEDSDVSDTFG